MSAPAPWFERRIRRGLAALMSLRMEGAPAADTVEATAKVWALALWPGRDWVEHLDDARIGEAFRRITLNETRWPTPAVFLRELPERELPPLLGKPAMTDEQRARAHEMLERIKTMLKEAKCTRQDSRKARG